MLLLSARAEATGIWLSIGVAAVLTTVAALSLQALFGRESRCLETAATTFCVAGVVGCFVIWDNYANTGLHYSTSFDDSFYYFNTRALVTEGLGSDTSRTFFEILLAGYSLLLAPFKSAEPTDLLPFNWFLASVSSLLIAQMVRDVTGMKRLPIAWLSVVTLGQCVYLSAVPFLYRDMLATVGFVGAVLFAWRRSWVACALFLFVATATRAAHGALAAFICGALVLVGTETFRRHRLLWTSVASIVLGAALFAASAASSSVLSSRSGDDGQSDVMTLALERQRTWTETFAEQRGSLGAQVMSLGPAGYPLRMVSGYFAPVILRPSERDVEVNTLFLPGSFGEFTKVRGDFAFTYAEWVTTLLWPLTAPLLILGMYRLATGDRRQRTLMVTLTIAFAFIMIVSMQERHRVEILAFNPAFIAMTLLRPWSMGERRFVLGVRAFVIVGIGALNLWAYGVGS